MKLDPRIKSLSDILTPFDTERAKELIGQKGFFANGIEFFRDGEPHCVYGTLTRVYSHQDQTDPYLKMEGDDLYSFFLPESSLKPEEKKPEEKKYRPYTREEFNYVFPIGEPIKYRERDAEGLKRHLILNGYWSSQSKDEIITYVYIGPFSYTLDDLFAAYEWEDPSNGSWRPFGVEVEE